MLQGLLWNPCCQIASLEFTFRSSLASPGLNLLIGSLHGAEMWGLSSLPAGVHWDPHILSGFQVVDQLGSPFKPEWPCSLRNSQSHSSSYFWIPPLPQDSLLGVSLGRPLGIFYSYLRPLFTKTSEQLFSFLCPVCEAGTRNSLSMRLLGCLISNHKSHPLHLSSPPKPIWRLQHYQPSSRSDTQGSSNTIVCSSLHLLSHSNC